MCGFLDSNRNLKSVGKLSKITIYLRERNLSKKELLSKLLIMAALQPYSMIPIDKFTAQLSQSNDAIKVNSCG